MTCYLFPVIIFSVIPLQRHPETCPNAIDGACGHRMSSLLVSRIPKVSRRRNRRRAVRCWRQGALLRCSRGCSGQPRPPKKCRNRQWETRTESSSVPLSPRGSPPGRRQEERRRRSSLWAGGTSRLRTPGSCAACRKLRQCRFRHHRLDNNQKRRIFKCEICHPLTHFWIENNTENSLDNNIMTHNCFSVSGTRSKNKDDAISNRGKFHKLSHNVCIYIWMYWHCDSLWPVCYSDLIMTSYLCFTFPFHSNRSKSVWSPLKLGPARGLFPQGSFFF